MTFGRERERERRAHCTTNCHAVQCLGLSNAVFCSQRWHTLIGGEQRQLDCYVKELEPMKQEKKVRIRGRRWRRLEVCEIVYVCVGEGEREWPGMGQHIQLTS